MNEKTVLYALAALLVGAAYLVMRQMQDDTQLAAGDGSELDPFAVDTAYSDGGDTMPDQLPGFIDSTIAKASMLSDSAQEAVGLKTAPDQATAQANEKAFLDMIAYAEGTSGPNGYRTMFGGAIFSDFADHPRQRFSFKNGKGEVLWTTAAGRYQFLIRTWDELQKKLSLPDFGPASQDAAALELIRQRGALGDVDAGRIADAVTKIAPIWASMPGAGYAQPEKKIASLLTAYANAGGIVSA